MCQIVCSFSFALYIRILLKCILAHRRQLCISSSHAFLNHENLLLLLLLFLLLLILLLL